MPRFALLIAPSTNRVYAEAALGLTRAELSIFSTVTTPIRDIAENRLGGVPYVTFEAELGSGDLRYLANLSSMYALFELVGDGLLRPVEVNPLAYFDEDLITIPKYAGKTNEQFTRLLLNVTLLASRFGPEMCTRRLTVLDPLCGRGTTLNQALRYGYHAIGIERDGKEVDAYAAFLRTYLKRKRLKHHAELNPVRRDRRLVARRFTATIAGEQTVTAFHADTIDARQFLKAGCADVIVADAPYGVAHGSHAGGTRTRAPLDLLDAAVPVWTELLAPGGALGISWNTHVAGRDAAAAILARHGLAVVELPDLAHRVDQAILRDIIVARPA
ncbi:MAG: DNA modification methylase [Actinobacteria bacterium 13_1_20CM_3_71_11]|nr:MAG: DNA modification methylase [Actinobacteria bacterium 13_1_20CM_3_71_11]